MVKEFKAINFNGKVIFHIGPHKTGSTSIQGFMNMNYEVLKEKGILYPKAGRMYSDNKLRPLHNPLIKSFIETGRIETEEYVEALREEIDSTKPNIVIISSEAMSREYISLDFLGSLQRIFHNAERCWVLFLRRQDELVLSRYYETIKVGSTAYPVGIEKVNKKEILDHKVRIEKLENSTFPDKIIPVSFDCSNDLIESFADVCGFDTNNCSVSGKKKNKSPPWGVIQIVRVLNTLPYILNRPFRRMAVRLGRRLPYTSSQKLFTWGKPMTDPELSKLLKGYEDSNRWVEEKYFDGEHVIGD